MKNKKGFTLIELLAVIVILAVIALIATPFIMNTINDAKLGSAKDSAYGIIKSGELQYALEHRDQLNTSLTGKRYNEISDLSYTGMKATKFDLIFDRDGNSDFIGFIGGFCLYKGVNDKDVLYDPTKKNANDCVTSERSNIVVDLQDDLIPVTYDANGNTVVANTSNDDWYNYGEKKWANAVSVTSVSRSNYQNKPGTQVNESDILGYFVYIPRYRYQLWNAENESKPEQEIKIEFETRNIKKSIGEENGEWLTHPAFTFGTKELNGIWVGKFELTGTLDTPTVKPNQVSLNGHPVSKEWEAVRKFSSDERYGLKKYDAHMMKNSEWGAVAYLSHSKYGKNNQLWINNVNTGTENYLSSTITGCSGTSESAGVKNNMTACEVGRDYRQNGVNASTTGNIYGIYDMAGGSSERMMSIVETKDGIVDFTQYGFSKELKEAYYDRYSYNTDSFNFSISKLGDAMKEVRKGISGYTQGWYSDYTAMPGYISGCKNCIWFHRGAYANGGGRAGIFDFDRSAGTGWSGGTTRVVFVNIN